MSRTPTQRVDELLQMMRRTRREWPLWHPARWWLALITWRLARKRTELIAILHRADPPIRCPHTRLVDCRGRCCDPEPFDYEAELAR